MTSAFLPFVHLNSRYPPRQRLILETTRHLHTAPTESRCHIVYPSHMSMPSLLPRSHDLSPPHSSSKHQHLSQDWISGASEKSTPSITDSSSSSPSRSPSLSPAEPSFPTRLIPPGVDVDGKSDSRIHNLDYLNLVNRYAYPFNEVTHSDVDVLSQLLLLYRFGTHRVAEHSDLILWSHSASCIKHRGIPFP